MIGCIWASKSHWKLKIAFYGKHFSLSLKINGNPKGTILGHICRFLGAKLDRWMKSRKPHIHGNEPWSFILCLREKGCQHATSQVADNVKGKCYPSASDLNFRLVIQYSMFEQYLNRLKFTSCTPHATKGGHLVYDQDCTSVIFYYLNLIPSKTSLKAANHWLLICGKFGGQWWPQSRAAFQLLAFQTGKGRFPSDQFSTNIQLLFKTLTRTSRGLGTLQHAWNKRTITRFQVLRNWQVGLIRWIGQVIIWVDQVGRLGR